jgi:hypothetical protein
LVGQILRYSMGGVRNSLTRSQTAETDVGAIISQRELSYTVLDVFRI